MARNSSQVRGKPNEVEEAFVPLFLRISVWTSRVMCASPARLRRAGGRWRLAVSRPLVKLQRLMFVILSVLSILAFIVDFLSEKQRRVYVGTTMLTAVACTIGACLLLMAYSFGVLTGPRRLKQTIFMLQQIHKIKTSIQRRNIRLQYSKVKHVLLILYITWQITCYFVLFCAHSVYFYFDSNPLVASLYTITGYQASVTAILQLEWSITLIEIGSTLKLVNDELEYMLKRSRQVQQFWHIAIQLNWIALHFSHVVTMVNPCHWFQEQKERTGHLLTGLACQASRRRLDPALLASFLQQTQMSGFPLGPCGVVTFNRPLVASFIAGIATYLIIIVQFQNVSEMI